MKNTNWLFLGLAIATVLFLMLVGIAIGERSVPGIIGASIGAFFVTGIGFSARKKMREKGKLL